MRKELLVEGRKITYFEEGEGFPFLMIHGWGPPSGQQFFKFHKILASRGFRVILPLLPGFEENGNGNGNGNSLSQWGMQEYLNCISDFTETLKLKEFILLGHSLGGALAIRLAVAHPQKVKILILLSPGILIPAKSRFWKWWVFRGGFHAYLTIIWLIKSALCFILGILKKLPLFLTKMAGVEKIVNGWVVNSEPYFQFLFRRNKIMCRILEHIVAFEDTIQYLPKISQPTCLLWGKKDFNYYLNHCLLNRGFVKRIKNCTVYVIPGVGHNIQGSVPEKTVELITNFIKKQESLD